MANFIETLSNQLSTARAALDQIMAPSVRAVLSPQTPMMSAIRAQEKQIEEYETALPGIAALHSSRVEALLSVQSTQAAYTREELEAMDLPALEKLTVALNVQTAPGNEHPTAPLTTAPLTDTSYRAALGPKVPSWYTPAAPGAVTPSRPLIEKIPDAPDYTGSRVMSVPTASDQPLTAHGGAQAPPAPDVMRYIRRERNNNGE